MQVQHAIKTVLAVSAITVAGISTASAAGLGPNISSVPIRIGVMAPKGVNTGKGIFQAAELAAHQINSNGGLKGSGRKIKLYKFNDSLSVSKAAIDFQRAVHSDQVVAMVGIFSSKVALAMESWAAKLKTPLIITGAASPNIEEKVHNNYNRFKYVFHGYTNSSVIAKEACIASQGILNNYPELKKYNRAVIFSEKGDWTKAVDAEYKKCLPKSGFNLVDTINFSPNTNDFTSLYNKIESDNANFIMSAIAHVGVEPVEQWHKQNVPAMFGGINGQASASDFWYNTNGATQGVITESPGAAGVPLTSKTQAFFKAYNKRFYTTEPVYDAYTTYDAMNTLKRAIERAGSTNANALVNAIEKTNFTGVTGHISYYGRSHKWTHEVKFDKGNPQKGASFVAFQWQNGKQVVIWPKWLAQGKPVIPSFVANSK